MCWWLRRSWIRGVFGWVLVFVLSYLCLATVSAICDCVVVLCGEQNMSNIFEKFQVVCHALGRSLSHCLWISVVSGLSFALMFLGGICLLKYRGWEFSAFRWRFIWGRGVVLGVVLLCSMSDVFFMGYGLLPWTGGSDKSSIFFCYGQCIASSLLCGFSCVVLARVPAGWILVSLARVCIPIWWRSVDTFSDCVVVCMCHPLFEFVFPSCGLCFRGL